MQKDPLKRIGVKDKNEIKNHAFFKGIDWGKVLRKEYKPPIEKLELTDKMLRKDESIIFKDSDYGDLNKNENRVPDFSFAMSFKEKMLL